MRITHFYRQNCKKSEETSMIFMKRAYFMYFEVQKLNLFENALVLFFFFVYNFDWTQRLLTTCNVILCILHLKQKTTCIYNIYIYMHYYIITIYYTIASYFNNTWEIMIHYLVYKARFSKRTQRNGNEQSASINANCTASINDTVRTYWSKLFILICRVGK